MPLDWATTQMNLGNALQILGIRESGTDRLEQAVTAYHAALEERTRDRVPLGWARTQMNLGNALATLGERKKMLSLLEEASIAYAAASKEWTHERVPLDWANMRANLAILECGRFDIDGDAAQLDLADGYAQEASVVFSEAEAQHYVEWVDGILADIERRRDALV